VAGVGATAPAVPAIDPNRFVDPELAQYVQQVTDQQNALIAQQQQQLADYQAQQAQLASYQAQQEQDRLMQQVQVGQNTFAESHPDFTPQDIDALVNQVATLQIVPSLMKKHSGNAAAAMSEAMETALWATPQFRDRAIQAQIDQFAQTTEQTAQKKRKASALSGSSGSVARTAPDARPMTKAEREQAMIREVANAMNGAEG
jgi:trans-aconitate methyltransferase